MNTHWYIHGQVVLETHIVPDGYVKVQDGVIIEIGQGEPTRIQRDDEVEDISGNWLVPGFVDVHVHGAAGSEFISARKEEINTVLRFHATHGTTCLLASPANAPIPELTAAIKVLADYTREDTPVGSRVGGIHVEGPFISEVRKGAMNPEYIAEPDPSIAREWIRISDGTIRLMTVASELPGATELISVLRSNGVTIGAGHTDATYEEAVEGFRIGITHAIHTFNGMRPLHHRDPGVLSAILSDDRVTCELICDGHHVHPGVIRLMYKAKGPRGIALITDAVGGTGLPDGQYEDVHIREGRIQLADGTLAGSTLTMDRAYKNILSYLPITPVEASLMASTNPAMSIGLGHKKGRIALGMDADLVVLNQHLDVIQTIVEGRKVHVSQ